ncbi:MAG: hypothetical protein SFY66_21245 [Oculatellaceae cyanobacterium bins.114]|nr:hypothetical protein [Oculatellaceae cyanobacterium bins.114]
MSEDKTIHSDAEISDEDLESVSGGEDNFPAFPNQGELPDSVLEGVAGGTRPPSGDSNPSDLTNTTVNSDDIIKPH